jgi:hypothetical protein
MGPSRHRWLFGDRKTAPKITPARAVFHGRHRPSPNSPNARLVASLTAGGCRSPAGLRATFESLRGRHGTARARSSQWAGHGPARREAARAALPNASGAFGSALARGQEVRRNRRLPTARRPGMVSHWKKSLSAISRKSPPHALHCSGNSSPTRAISFAQVIRVARAGPFTRVAPASCGVPVDHIPAGRGLAPLPDVAFRQRRDGFSQPVIRCEHTVVAVPMLPQWRHEIGKPCRPVPGGAFCA